MRVSKDAYYFSHDYNSRNDVKCIALIESHGYEGYGLFWAVVETMAEQTGFRIPGNLIGSLYRSYGVDKGRYEDVLKRCLEVQLFCSAEDGAIYSPSLLRRMQERKAKLEQAREAGKIGAQARWGRHSGSDSDPIAKKGKERKGSNNTHTLLRDVLSGIGEESRANAELFHAAVEHALSSRGYSVEREFKVPDRGDGRAGFVDLLVTAPVRFALELDRYEPREKSLFKLHTLGCPGFVICRETDSITPVSGRTQAAQAAPLVFPKELDTPAVHSAWAAWLEHKAIIKKPYKNPRSARIQLAKWRKQPGGASRFIAAIRHSIGQGWTGIFDDPDFVKKLAANSNGPVQRSGALKTFVPPKDQGPPADPKLVQTLMQKAGFRSNTEGEA